MGLAKAPEMVWLVVNGFPDTGMYIHNHLHVTTYVVQCPAGCYRQLTRQLYVQSPPLSYRCTCTVCDVQHLTYESLVYLKSFARLCA